MRLLAVFLLAPSLAFGQGVTLLRPGQASAGKVLASYAFATEGCLTAAQAGITTCPRTGAGATYFDSGGTLQTCASGSTLCRVTTKGLVAEAGATNYLLNYSTHPKASEATASLGNGGYVAHHAGTGTLTVVAGTATVTGLSCSAVAANTPCTFTVTSPGTVVVTTTEGTTYAQVTGGLYGPSNFIPTAGSTVARNNDHPSVTVPSVPSRWCLAATITPHEARTTWTNTSGETWQLGTRGTANSARLTATAFVVIDATTTSKSVSFSAPTATTHRVVACSNDGALSVTIDGVLVSGSATGAGTGILATPPTTLYIGGNTGYQFNSYTKDLKICAAANAKECK